PSDYADRGYTPGAARLRSVGDQRSGHIASRTPITDDSHRTDRREYDGCPQAPAAGARRRLDGAVAAGALSPPRRRRMKKDISSLRSTLEYLDAIGELVTTDVEVDPHLEVAAIQKHFDGGAALLFNKVKGYPNARICNNIFASAERVS